MINFTVYSSLSILSVVTLMETELVYTLAQADKGETRRAHRNLTRKLLKKCFRILHKEFKCYIKSVSLVLLN